MTDVALERYFMMFPLKNLNRKADWKSPGVRVLPTGGGATHRGSTVSGTGLKAASLPAADEF